jgi:chromosome segregation ATPase
VSDAKNAAARATGDTAYKQVEKATKTKYEYKMKLLRRHHADEMMNQEDNIGEEAKNNKEKAEYFENKFRALERAQNGYMQRITSSEERAHRAEVDGKADREQARIAVTRARSLELELQVTAESCAKAEKSNRILRTKRDTLTEKLKKSEQRLIALESDMAVRGQKIIALEEAIAAQNVNTSGVAERVKAEKEKQRLREIAVETLQSDCENAKIRASKMQERAERLEKQLNNIRKERDELEHDVHHLTEALHIAEDKHGEYEKHVSDARREADDMRVQMMHTSKHHRRMSVQLNERVMQAHLAVSQVVKGMSGPPPDFDPNNDTSFTVDQESSIVLMSQMDVERPWSPPNAGGSLVSPSMATEKNGIGDDHSEHKVQKEEEKIEDGKEGQEGKEGKEAEDKEQEE